MVEIETWHSILTFVYEVVGFQVCDFDKLYVFNFNLLVFKAPSHDMDTVINTQQEVLRSLTEIK